jgi:hypothetical protein
MTESREPDAAEHAEGEAQLSELLDAGPYETGRERSLLAKILARGSAAPEVIARAFGDPEFGPGEAEEWAEEMLDRGLLEPADDVPDAYRVTDEGRRAIGDTGPSK